MDGTAHVYSREEIDDTMVPAIPFPLYVTRTADTEPVVVHAMLHVPPTTHPEGGPDNEMEFGSTAAKGDDEVEREPLVRITVYPEAISRAVVTLPCITYEPSLAVLDTTLVSLPDELLLILIVTGPTTPTEDHWTVAELPRIHSTLGEIPMTARSGATRMATASVTSEIPLLSSTLKYDVLAP